MSEDPVENDQGSPQAGVLGNLPNSRPAVRSPRRRTEPPQRRAEEREPQREPEPPEQGEPTEQPLDLEALARGGIAVAGEAASLGLRLAGRAAAAMRDAVERR